jgi:hypothetical protein
MTIQMGRMILTAELEMHGQMISDFLQIDNIPDNAFRIMFPQTGFFESTIFLQ